MLGQTKKFSFDTRTFEIIEEIGESNISMEWNWGSQVCPHCKKKIDKIMTHVFKVIEVLAPKELLDKNTEKKELLKDVIMLGLDEQGRKLLLTKEIQEQALKYSAFFKEVI